MKSRFSHVLITCVILLLMHAPCARAQFSVGGGNPTLSVTTGMAGAQPLSVTGTANSLRYRLQNSITKITVRTVCPGQNFNLTVVATAVPYGVAAPTVNLINGMLDTDFITDIQVKPPNANQTASILYTASATFAQGNSAELGDDVHTVTYTFIEQ